MPDALDSEKTLEISKTQAPAIPLKQYALLLICVWTGVIALSLGVNLLQERLAVLEIARAEARGRIDQVLLYREWSALHGGVYVKVDEKTPPSPYLAQNPERDLKTPSGRALTLINSAYLVRQLYELALSQNKNQGRIISLKPLRPENTPDLWETKALNALEQGGAEFSAVQLLPDQDYLRLIQPLKVEKACLDCHASQGYQVGDIRGGISVQVPLEPFRAAGRQHQTIIWLSHIFLWLLGLGGISLAYSRLDQSAAKQEEIAAGLQDANQALDALINAAPLAIVALDAHGSVRLWNPAAESIFGWRATEAIGYPPPFLSEELQKEFRELFSGGLRGDKVSGEGECRHKTGIPMNISFFMSPLYRANNELSGVVIVLEDVTERRQAEGELIKANEKLKAWVFEFGHRNRDITLLNEMGDVLQACHTLDEAYTGVKQYVPQMFPELPGVLFVLNKEKSALEAAAVWGAPPHGALVFAPDECWALRRGQGHLVQDLSAGLTCRHLEGQDFKSCLCVPLVSHTETMGLFMLLKISGETAQEAVLSEPKQRLATTVAKQVALSLANLNLRNNLIDQAIHDPLTGLFNRRYMEETLEREILRVRRKGVPLGIIMVDIDHFKRVNDIFGHEAGDAMLRAVASFIKGCVRREDIACRYGGEEFILIMPEASGEITGERAEQIRQGVERLQVDYDGEILRATVSLGVAVYPLDGEQGDAVIKAADAALYRAKEGGRNRVATAGEAAGAGKPKGPLKVVKKEKDS
jgi:diguanylate cyclase (GGDEF)-like protein/PAS domain S-box-containing protein